MATRAVLPSASGVRGSARAFVVDVDTGHKYPSRSVEPVPVLVVQDGRHAPGRRTGHRRKRLHTPTRSPLSGPTGAAFGVLDAGRQITYPEHETRLTQGHTGNDNADTIIPKNIDKQGTFSGIGVSPSA
jgi:hypothetical protein